MPVHNLILIMMLCLIPNPLYGKKYCEFPPSWPQQSEPINVCLTPPPSLQNNPEFTNLLLKVTQTVFDEWLNSECAPIRIAVLYCDEEFDVLRSNYINNIVFVSNYYQRVTKRKESFATTAIYADNKNVIREADILFDDDRDWHINNQSFVPGKKSYQVVDFRSTLIHEVGHFLGLHHIDEPNCARFNGRGNKSICLAVEGCLWTDFHNNCYKDPDLVKRYCNRTAYAALCSQYHHLIPPSVTPVDREKLCNLYGSINLKSTVQSQNDREQNSQD